MLWSGYWDILIKATSNVGLIYGKRSEEVEIEGLVDLDYARDKDDRRSITGYFFTMARSCVSWKSEWKPIVTLSTNEPKFIAATKSIKEEIWL